MGATQAVQGACRCRVPGLCGREHGPEGTGLYRRRGERLRDLCVERGLERWDKKCAVRVEWAGCGRAEHAAFAAAW